MAATSPYTQNDYQAVSTFRPYQLPVNDVMKAFVAQNQFWDEGARRVKSAYDNAADLQLTNKENQQIRDNYLQDAQKQLTKLSSMDLSDPDVQRKGLALFTPLYKDEGIVSDDAATRHIMKVNSDALSYRGKENGKFYSATNHQYAMMGAKEFQNSTDRMAGKQYLSNAREYEPFHDPTAELSNIMKNCKPNKASGESIQGFYNRGYSDESLSSMKVASCIDAGLSDQARRQLQINAAVTYKDQPEALRAKYVPHLQGLRHGYSEDMAAIQGVLANEGNLKNLKPADLQKLGLSDVSQLTPDFIKMLHEKAKSLNDNIINTDQTIERLQSGNFEDIMGKNFEHVASSVYSRDWMQNVGEGFSYDWKSNSVKADPVQMMFYKEAQQNARQEDDQQYDAWALQKKFDNDLQLKQMDMAGKLLGKNAKDITQGDLDLMRVHNTADGPFSDITTGESYNKITGIRTDIANARAGLNNRLFSQMRSSFGLPEEVKSTSDPAFQKWYDNFKLTAKGDPVKEGVINEYEDMMNNLILKETKYKGLQDWADKQVAPMQVNIANEASKIQPFNIRGGTISGADISNAILGKPGALQISVGSMGTQGSPLLGMSSAPIGEDRVTFNGQPLSGNDKAKVLEAYRQLNNTAGLNRQKMDETRNTLLQSQTVVQGDGFIVPELNDDKSGFKVKLAAAIGLPIDKIKDLIVGQTDLKGNVQVTLAQGDEAGKNYDPAVIKKNLMMFNAGNNRELKDGSVLLTGIPDATLPGDVGVMDEMRPTLRILEMNTTDARPQSTNFIRGASNKSFRIDIAPGFQPNSYMYKIVDQDSPTAPVYIARDREDALATFQKIIKSK
jgi:hypothetical protein